MALGSRYSTMADERQTNPGFLVLRSQSNLTSVKTEFIVTVAKLVLVLGAAVTVLYCVVRDTIVEYWVAVCVA